MADVDRSRPQAHKATRRLGRDGIAEMVRLYKAGVGSVQLSRKFGMQPKTVRQVLRDEGVEIKQHQRLTPERANEARRLYVDEGYSLVRVSEQLGLAPTSVRRLLLKEGVTLRGRWDWRRNENCGGLSSGTRSSL